MYKQIEMSIREIGKIINSVDCDRTASIEGQLLALNEKRNHFEKQLAVAEFLSKIEEDLNDRHIEDT